MKKNEFVDVINEVAVKNTISSFIQGLEKPPGRQPDNETIEQSLWYNKLNSEDKNLLKKIITQSIRFSTFNFFAVLDGVASIHNIDDIDESGDYGKLKLFFEKNNKMELINSDSGEMLHDIFKSISMEM